MGYHKKHREMLEDPYYTETVARLRQARENADLSQLIVARAIGVTWESVSAWERGVTIPSLYHFLEWCKVLVFEVKEKQP